MSFKSSKIYIIISFFFLLNSCGLLRSDNRDINYKIVDVSEVPSDREFRDAWTIDDAELTDGVGE